MLIVRTSDGLTLRGENATQILETLGQKMWVPESPSTYIAGIRARVKEVYGEELLFTDAEQFLAELLRIGVLKKIGEESCDH